MRLNHVMVVALGAILLAAPAAAAQERVWTFAVTQPDRSPYQEGLEQGMWDARHFRPAHPVVVWRWGRDRIAYENGYNRGYQIVLAENRRLNLRERGWQTARVFPPAVSSLLVTARQTGYEDGLDDGAFDRDAGFAFRLTLTDNYQDADRGFDARFVGRDLYQQHYREGYQLGYRRGFRGL